jgi:uncharacterized protein YqgC (DUF456 family)
MEIVWIILGILVILVGIIGCFVPVLPGPPLAYIALILLQFGESAPFSSKFLIILGIVVVAVTLLDYAIPALGAKKWGGSRYGILGALIGVVIGLFVLPPFGFLIFPILGATLGEMLIGTTFKKALKAGFGALAGLVMGTMLKFSITIVIGYYFFTNL